MVAAVRCYRLTSPTCQTVAPNSILYPPVGCTVCMLSSYSDLNSCHILFVSLTAAAAFPIDYTAWD